MIVVCGASTPFPVLSDTGAVAAAHATFTRRYFCFCFCHFLKAGYFLCFIWEYWTCQLFQKHIERSSVEEVYSRLASCGRACVAIAADWRESICCHSCYSLRRPISFYSLIPNTEKILIVHDIWMCIFTDRYAHTTAMNTTAILPSLYAMVC